LLLGTVKILQSAVNFEHNNKNSYLFIIMHLESISTTIIGAALLGC